MKIQAIGGCCKKAIANYQAILTAVKELGITDEVVHVADWEEIIKLGIIATPGLVIDDKIISTGRVLNVKQAKELIKKHLNN